MQPALGRVPLAEARLHLADGVRLPLVGSSQSVQDVGSALGEARPGLRTAVTAVRPAATAAGRRSDVRSGTRNRRSVAPARIIHKRRSCGFETCQITPYE